MSIKTITEGKRGCGYRKPGGIYLVGGSAFATCGMLPIALDVCPCCHQGIKPSRGFAWISPDIWKGKTCKDADECKKCQPFFNSPEKVGLMWVGGKFYRSPGDFMSESIELGVSKRIAQIPKDLKIGETWVMLAHREPEPHIFSCFIPTEIQYVVKGDESQEELERMEKRGITPVNVIYKDENVKQVQSNEAELFDDEPIDGTREQYPMTFEECVSEDGFREDADECCKAVSDQSPVDIATVMDGPAETCKCKNCGTITPVNETIEVFGHDYCKACVCKIRGGQ